MQHDRDNAEEILLFVFCHPHNAHCLARVPELFAILDVVHGEASALVEVRVVLRALQIPFRLVQVLARVGNRKRFLHFSGEFRSW